MKTPTSSESLIKTGLKIGLGTIGIVSGAILFWYTAQVLLVFFAALFLAIFLSGIGRYLEARTRFTYPTCVAFILIGLLQLFILSALVIGPAIAGQSATLAEALPNAYHQLTDQIKSSQIGAHLFSAGQRALDASKDSN